jgi:hypothetical protein
MQVFTILWEGARVEELRDPGNECELFVTVGAQNGDGAQVSGVHPGENMPGQGDGLQASRDGHWFNIEENRGPDTILNHFIYREALQPGQRCRVALGFYDAGNGNLDTAKRAAARAAGVVASKSGEPLVAAIASVVAIGFSLIPANPTKPLGFALVEGYNNNGQLRWEVQGGKFVAEVEDLAPTGTTDRRYQGGSWGGVRLKLRPQKEDGVQGSDVDIFLRMILREE